MTGCWNLQKELLNGSTHCPDYLEGVISLVNWCGVGWRRGTDDAEPGAAEKREEIFHKLAIVLKEPDEPRCLTSEPAGHYLVRVGWRVCVSSTISTGVGGI